MTPMFRQYLTLSIFFVMFAVVAGGVSRMRLPGEDAPVVAAADAGPWSKRSGQGSSIPEKNGGEVQLQRDSDSHFYVNAVVNGSSIRMMVDSGASMIALTRRDAEAIGIDVDSLPASGSANTAGGVVPVRPVELNSVGVDGLTVVSVQAAVIDADMPTSLLGQSFLSRLQSVEVSGDTMTLR
jgi:aspartyl protease family protein